jgi:hypothetical protein
MLVVGRVFCGFVLLTSLWITGLMVPSNPQVANVRVVAELLVATTWLALILNGAFALVAVPSCVALRHLPGVPRSPVLSDANLASGFVACHLCWLLLYRLDMSYQWLSVRPFINFLGVIQIVGLGCLAAAVAMGSRQIIAGRRRAGAVALVASTLLAASLLASNAVIGVRHHQPELTAGLGSPQPKDEMERDPDARPKVLVLGVDGLSWNVLEPLMSAGALPGFSRLVEHGTIGYIDNRDEALSARIWPTVFTGHSTSGHALYDFEKLVLGRSNANLPATPVWRPSVHSLYGLDDLWERLPSLGLWKMEQTSNLDSPVKSIWEVAADFGLVSGVANVFYVRAGSPFDGFVIKYVDVIPEGLVYPADAARDWAPPLIEDDSYKTETSLAQWAERLTYETEYSIRLFEEYDVDLAIYYTHVVDSFSHFNWDFFSPASFYLRDLPRNWPEERWEQVVAERRNDLPFASYLFVDRLVARYLEAFSHANIIVVSDHGWSFSGFEHFMAPDGVVILAGPDIRGPKVLPGASTADIAPTVLALLGIPIAEDLDGRVLEEALVSLLRLDRIATYGEVNRQLQTPAATDEEELRRLRALGYIR